MMSTKTSAIIRAVIYVIVAVVGLASALGLVSQEVSDWMSGNAETFIGLISSVAAMGGGILAISNLHHTQVASDVEQITVAERHRTSSPGFTTGSAPIDLGAIINAERSRGH